MGRGHALFYVFGKLLSRKEGEFSWIFPHVDNEREVNPKRRATHGVAQAAFARICEKFGFEKGLTLRSPRNWFATCAGKLLYPREHREKLGRWAPCSIMPDHYDRAVCTTELRVRAEIIQKFQGDGAHAENSNCRTWH